MTLRSRSWTLKFCVEVLDTLYLLNMWIDVVDIKHVRYLSEVLCCIIWTHLSDLEVKVMGFEILC